MYETLTNSFKSLIINENLKMSLLFLIDLIFKKKENLLNLFNSAKSLNIFSLNHILKYLTYFANSSNIDLIDLEKLKSRILSDNFINNNNQFNAFYLILFLNKFNMKLNDNQKENCRKLILNNFMENRKEINSDVAKYLIKENILNANLENLMKICLMNNLTLNYADVLGFVKLIAREDIPNQIFNEYFRYLLRILITSLSFLNPKQRYEVLQSTKNRKYILLSNMEDINTLIQYTKGISASETELLKNLFRLDKIVK